MSKSIGANSYSFNYVEAGAGSPLLFVHGLLADYRYWSREVSYFSKHFRTIAVSRRHHWPKGGKVPFSYRVQTHVDDVLWNS